LKGIGTTYFGQNPEYVEGIHMLPIGSHSGLTRPVEFVTEEWATYFSNGRIDSVNSGWKSIVYASYAFINPKAVWSYFSSPTFNAAEWLDGGASQSWYLAMAAILGGA
jgi:endo-1,3(4)-beta-glucanase